MSIKCLLLPEIRNMSIADLKHQELPLARIKKIMKLDEDVKVSYNFWQLWAQSYVLSVLSRWSLLRLLCFSRRLQKCSSMSSLWEPGFTQRCSFFLFLFFYIETCQMKIFDFMYKLTEYQDNKRRTLQRNDIAMAITKYDQFDFLIDIVPRYCFKIIQFWSQAPIPPNLKSHVSLQGWYQANNKEGRIKCEDGSWSG